MTGTTSNKWIQMVAYIHSGSRHSDFGQTPAVRPQEKQSNNKKRISLPNLINASYRTQKTGISKNGFLNGSAVIRRYGTVSYVENWFG
jgi:hypothetical protein